MALTPLPLSKPGEAVKKLTLSLSKGARFTVELAWDSKHDLDAHALEGTNNGDGAKVSDFAQVLSTYNVIKPGITGPALPRNPDGSFSTISGALMHSGDKRDGTLQGVDEMITIDGARIPAGVNEIPIFVTVHPSTVATFRDVKQASITIKSDDGRTLGAYQLTNEFGAFNAVQMGSLMATSTRCSATSRSGCHRHAASMKL